MPTRLLVAVLTAFALFGVFTLVEGQRPPGPAPAPDAVAQAQTPSQAPPAPNAHDRSDVSEPAKAPPSSPAFVGQPEKGQPQGFDFARDPLNAKKPMQTFDESLKADVAEKQKVMDAQRKLLERRYDLTPKLDPNAKMSRGKPLAVGPTARLASASRGMGWRA